MKIDYLCTYNFKAAFRGMRNPLNSWSKSDSYFGDKTNILLKEKLIASRWAEYFNNKRSDSNKPAIDGEQLISSYMDLLHIEYLKSPSETILLGPNDLVLAQKLIQAGSEHRKFLRQIIVSFDLTAPLYFWKEFDTYKVGTVANSTSTMHKLASTPITLDCFEIGDYEPGLIYLEGVDETGDYPFDYHSCVSDLVETNGLNSYSEPTIIQFLEELRLKYLETKDKAYWKELIRWLPESWLQTRTILMNYENVHNIIHQRQNHKLSEWDWLINQFKNLPYAEMLLFLKEK